MCVTDEMVEAGWQSFVRAGVDKRTQNAYVSKTDLRAALEAALSHAAGQEAPTNPAEIGRKSVGGEAVAWMRRNVTYKAVDGRADGERVVSERKVYDDDLPLYLAPAQPPASAEVGRKLMDDLNRIAYGYLPDGDGVDTSVALWAEQTLSRMAASSGRSESPIAGVTHGTNEGVRDE